MVVGEPASGADLDLPLKVKGMDDLEPFDNGEDEACPPGTVQELPAPPVHVNGDEAPNGHGDGATDAEIIEDANGNWRLVDNETTPEVAAAPPGTVEEENPAPTSLGQLPSAPPDGE